MLAAITGAIAASGLGIAGTLVGAAFMSLASTVGAAVYRHYISRSNERLRAAAASLAPKASGSVVAAALVRHHQAPGADSGTTGSLSTPGTVNGAAADAGAGYRTAPASGRLTATRPAASPPGSAAPEAGAPAAMPDWAYAADAAGTTVLPPVAGRPAGMQAGGAGSGNGGTWPGQGNPGEAGGSDPAATRDLPPDDLTRVRPAAADPGDDVTRTWFRDTAPGNGSRTGAPADTTAATVTGAETTAAAGPGSAASGDPVRGPGDHGAEQPGTGRTRGLPGGRRRWLISALAAVSVFVIAMGAVTAIEAVAGKPLETVVWHKKGSGTTVGGLVNGPARHRHTRPAPSTSPSAPASPSSTPATTPPAAPTPAPTGSGSTAPSPTPSSSVPVSPAPTVSGGAG
jgi:hypothetical protein